MSPQKLFTALILSAGVVTTAAGASEIEKPFVGLDYSVLTFDGGSDAEFKPHAARLRAGSVLSKYIAVEVHAAGGTRADTLSLNFGAPIGTLDVCADLKSLYAVFLRPQMTLGSLHLYALAGYGYANIDLSLPGLTVESDEDQSDFSFGAGAELDIGSHWGANVSYVRYLEDIDAVGAGVVYRF